MFTLIEQLEVANRELSEAENLANTLESMLTVTECVDLCESVTDYLGQVMQSIQMNAEDPKHTGYDDLPKLLRVLAFAQCVGAIKSPEQLPTDAAMAVVHSFNAISADTSDDDTLSLIKRAMAVAASKNQALAEELRRAAGVWNKFLANMKLAKDKNVEEYRQYVDRLRQALAGIRMKAANVVQVLAKKHEDAIVKHRLAQSRQTLAASPA